MCPLLTCSCRNGPAFHALLQPRPLLSYSVMHRAWKQTGNRGLSYFLNANDPLASQLTSLSTAWLHCRPDPPWKLSVTRSCHRSCVGIEVSNVKRELASLAIWTCVFKMGFDMSTRASIISLRRATYILWLSLQNILSPVSPLHLLLSFPLFSFVTTPILEHVLTRPVYILQTKLGLGFKESRLNKEISTPTREYSHFDVDSKRLERDPGKRPKKKCWGKEKLWHSWVQKVAGEMGGSVNGISNTCIECVRVYDMYGAMCACIYVLKHPCGDQGTLI